MTTTPQHTPGPWEVYTLGIIRMKGSITQVATADLYLVDKYMGHRIGQEERAANARLIAACPLMVDYLRKLADNGDQDARHIVEVAIEGYSR